MSFLWKTYRVYVKIFKKNIVDVCFDDNAMGRPRGFVEIEHGMLDPKGYAERKKFFEDFKEDYLGCDIFHYTYKKGVRVKTEEMLDLERKAIEENFAEGVEVEVDE